MKQHEAVIQAMELNGGYATLGQLNQTVLKIPDCEWGTKTPFASIRRIVQTHSEFFKLRPGLWALASDRVGILKELGLFETKSSSIADEFSHSYFQGLIVEIGNFKGHLTFVPHQDKNRLFLQRRLAEVATLPKYYDFTFKEILARARMIDVTWFNPRKFPQAFFEIEHSTDMRNSLAKFVEFQDFRVEFFIVADTARRREFESKVRTNAYAPVSAQVKFIDYDALSDLHSKLSVSRAAERALKI